MTSEGRGPARGDETEKMAAMDRWLDAVCAELDVDRGILDASSAGLLRLISDVAHGPSRPGAPLTAFLVGLAAARTDEPVAALTDGVERLSALSAGWDATHER